MAYIQSGRGLPHSMTLSRLSGPYRLRPCFGVRQSSAALDSFVICLFPRGAADLLKSDFDFAPLEAEHAPDSVIGQPITLDPTFDRAHIGIEPLSQFTAGQELLRRSFLLNC